MTGALTGVDLATQAHYCTLAGVTGMEDLAVKPEYALKHGDEHVKLVLGRKYVLPKLKYIDVPAHTKRGCVRQDMRVPVRLPTDILSEAHGGQTAPSGDDPCADVMNVFADHPVVRQARIGGLHWSQVLIVCLYWDGVQYTTRDNFLAFYLNDMRTNKIHLLFLYRKSDLCACGCRGWCSVYPLVLELGLNLRHGAVDGFRVACLMTKGDWPAYTDIAGVRQW